MQSKKQWRDLTPQVLACSYLNANSNHTDRTEPTEPNERSASILKHLLEQLFLQNPSNITFLKTELAYISKRKLIYKRF